MNSMIPLLDDLVPNEKMSQELKEATGKVTFFLQENRISVPVVLEELATIYVQAKFGENHPIVTGLRTFCRMHFPFDYRRTDEPV